MHAYIHIHSIHAHMYAYLYMHTHCMDATTPHAVPSSTIHQTLTLHYILTHAFYITTHTHTLLTLVRHAVPNHEHTWALQGIHQGR